MNDMRLIDADALMEATRNFCDGYKVKWTDNKVMAWINSAPTIDAVPVVRCYQCKHYVKTLMLCQREDGLGTPDKLDFCSYGERKENNHD